MSSDQGVTEGLDKDTRRRMTLVLCEEPVITQLVDTGNASKLKREDNKRRKCYSRMIESRLLTATKRSRTQAQGRIKGHRSITERGRERRSL